MREPHARTGRSRATRRAARGERGAIENHLFVLAISRYGEYVADTNAAESTGAPDALARALSVIHETGTVDEVADVDSATASMCIFGGERGRLGAIFSTHPAMEKRVERLQAMADR